MEQETQTFTITYDESIADVSQLQADLGALQRAERAESVKHAVGHAGTILSGLTCASMERIGYAVVNAERAVRWLGREIILDALVEDHDGGYGR